MKKEDTLPAEWVPGAYSKTLAKKYATPLYVLIVTIFSVFISEVLIMFILAVMPFSFGLSERAFLDGTLLTFLIFPIFYLFLFRPMVLHINERRKSRARVAEGQYELGRTSGKAHR